MKKIILASTSPRRKTILDDLGIEFKIVAPDFSEEVTDEKFTYELIESFAYNKALSVAKKTNESALIIGADTMVVLEEMILGKPKTEKDAFHMLKLLNGKEHKVVTSISIIDTKIQSYIIESTTSYVFFNTLKEKDLLDYINNFKPLDKAGAYGIQELPDYFVKNITGEFDNIIGLPSKTLLRLFKKLNFKSDL